MVIFSPENCLKPARPGQCQRKTGYCLKGTLLAAGRNELRGFKSSSSDVKCTYSGPNMCVLVRLPSKSQRQLSKGKLGKGYLLFHLFTSISTCSTSPNTPRLGLGKGGGKDKRRVMSFVCDVFAKYDISIGARSLKPIQEDTTKGVKEV